MLSPAARDRPGMPPPMLEAGQRWTLAARLKCVHSEANFGLRDMEVSMSAMPRRLPHDTHGLLLAIERLRARIESVLADAPHRGMVIALAVGAQDAVSEPDWSLMRATGTSYLVAISGLHIGFGAALGAFDCGFVWWRLRIWSMPAALIVATPHISALGAALCAALYAALASFNVSPQRVLWMLLVVAATSFLGRNPASSLVLCWTLAFVVIADPWAVTSPGFWLSFCEVAAIIYAMESRGRRASRKREEPDDAFEALDWNDRGEAAYAATPIEADDLVECAERRASSAALLPMCFRSSRAMSVPARVSSSP